MLVCPAVFKTVAGGEELPRWVRFPHTLAKKSPEYRGFLLVLSLLLPKNVAPKKQDISAFLKEAAKPFHFFGVKFFVRFASSLSEGAFWHCTTQKLSPRAGKVIPVTPTLYITAKSCPRVRGKWHEVPKGVRLRGGCECNEQPEGLHRGCSCLRQPLSQTFGLPAPRQGSLLGTVPPNARARYPANYRLYA